MFSSRLPKIAADLELKLDAIAAAGAEKLAQHARERVPVRTGKLRDAIHVEHEGPGEYAVIAGNNQAFYGHIVEHGGAHTPARAFMTPATEQTRVEILATGIAVLRSL